MSRWFSFPSHPGRETDARTRGPRRILFETSDGYLVLVSLQRFATGAGAIVDAFRHNLPSGKAPTATEMAVALDALGLGAVSLDDPIESADTWGVEAAVKARLAAEALVAARAGRPLPERAAVQADLQAGLRDGIAGFVAGLDSEAIEVARRADDLRPSTYNYLIGIGGRSRRNRLEAGGLFPLLLPSLARNDDFRFLVECIDAGRPLLPALGWFFGVKPSVVKAVRGVAPTVAGPHWGVRPGVLLRLLNDQPAERRPRDPASWEAFNSTVAMIARVSGQPATTAANRVWLRACANREYRVGTAIPANAAGVRDLEDFLSALHKLLRWRMLGCGGTPHVVEVEAARAARLLSSAHDIGRLGDLARRWRAAYLSAENTCSEARELLLGVRWLAPLAGPRTLGERTLVPLLTPADLAEEGRAMKHCVGSYALPCMRGESQIFSLRSDGRRCSTLETAVARERDGVARVVLVQHRGPANRDPSEPCRGSAAALIRHLNDRRDALEDYLRWRADVASVPLSERAAAAAMQPVAAAFNAVLPGRWSIEALVRESLLRGGLAGPGARLPEAKRP